MDELARHIEQNLIERGFCVVWEDELERCWRSEEINPADRENQIQIFAKSRGWIVSILDTDFGMRALFEPHTQQAAPH